MIKTREMKKERLKSHIAQELGNIDQITQGPFQ